MITTKTLRLRHETRLVEVSDLGRPGRLERISKKKNVGGVVRLQGAGHLVPPDGKPVPSPLCPVGVVIAQQILMLRLVSSTPKTNITTRSYRISFLKRIISKTCNRPPCTPHRYGRTINTSLRKEASPRVTLQSDIVFGGRIITLHNTAM